MTTTKQAIAIFHPLHLHPSNVDEIFDSIETDYPIMITNHGGFQIDAVRKMFSLENKWDEIFFLHETMIVKDNSVWEEIFEIHKGKTVTFHPDFQMFITKYIRKYVEQIPFPTVNSRADDIEHGEGTWNFAYKEADPNYVLLDPLLDPNPSLAESHEWKYGRDNIVLENKYFKKWKSVWNINMLKE